MRNRINMFCGLLPVASVIVWNFTATSFIADAKTFKPLLSKYGSFTCALDYPTAVIQLSQLRLGIPSGVPDSVQCAFGCEGFTGCTSFNYRQQHNASIDDGYCELFMMSPMNCAAAVEYCQFHQVSSLCHCLCVVPLFIDVSKCTRDSNYSN